MAVAGSLTYDTKIDKNGFNKGLKNLESSVNSTGTKIKNIVAALGIDRIISTAFGILNSSIDAAISRLDTLNNFPKVMSNLGIASDDAQKSINKMSDKLSGLPTTLDAGAQAVQSAAGRRRAHRGGVRGEEAPAARHLKKSKEKRPCRALFLFAQNIFRPRKHGRAAAHRLR